MTSRLFIAAVATVSTLALAQAASAQQARSTDTPATSAGQPTTTGTTAPDQGSTDRTSTPDSATSDVVVTAQRRVERVVDVPISITVANQAQLERQQVNTVNDLNRIAPSLEIQAAPGQNTGGGGTIRGIGTQTNQLGATASVGVVVDQVSQGNANIGDLFDIARVEVLKGPQGTLFGLTTSAGVLNITTNAPDPTRVAARVRTEVSNNGTAGSQFGNQILQAMFNAPIASNAALRVSGLINLRQGVNENALTGKLNNVDRYAGRARFLWEPTDRLTVNLIGDYASSMQNGGGDFFTFIRASGPGVLPLPTPFPIVDTVGIAARLASCGVTVGEGNKRYCTTRPQDTRTQTYGGSAQIDYQFEPFTITSISSLRRNNSVGGSTDIFRAAPLEFQIFAGDMTPRIKLFTQELRLASRGHQLIDYTVGAFYSRQTSRTAPSYFNISLSPFPGLTIPLVSQAGATNDVTDRQVAVFGEGTLHLGSALRLIAGGRYTDADLGLRNIDAATSVERDQRLRSHVWTYRFGAQYDLGANTMVYGTASKGFKGGQISVPALPAQPFVLLPELPQDYELGLKSTLFGGWIMDLNAFYEKVRNLQAQQCTSSATTGALSCVSTNIDGVVSKGGEANFFGRVTRNLSVNTGFIYTDVRYPKNFLGTDGTNIGGGQLAYAPRYKFTLSGEYEQHLSDGLSAFFAADTVWKSRLRYEANSVDATTFRPHWLVGGRLGVRTSDRLQAAIFVRNLFDVHEPILLQSGFPYGGAANIGAIYGQQSYRQVGLSVDLKL